MSTDLDQLKARAEAAEKWKWTFGGLGGTPEIAWAFYKGLENNKIAWQEKAEAAEALVAELQAEINRARRAWLGDDYGHLPLVDAMEKYRADVEARIAELEADIARESAHRALSDSQLAQAERRMARLVAAGNMMRVPGDGKATPLPPADDDGLTDADFAELVQELKKEGQA